MPVGDWAETGKASKPANAAAATAALIRIAGLSNCLVLCMASSRCLMSSFLSIFEDDGTERKCHFRNSDAPCRRSKSESRALWRRYASSSIHQRGRNQSKAPEVGLGRSMSATMNGRKGYAALRVFDCGGHPPSSSAHARGAAGREKGGELWRVRARP